MRFINQKLLATAALCAAWATPAWATFVAPFGSDGLGTGLQTKLNSLVTPGAGDTWNPGVKILGDYINGTVQNGQSVLDVLWRLSGPSSASATIVLELAGNGSANAFGFYDPSNPSKKVQLFAGSASTGSKVYVKFNGNQVQTSPDNVNFSNVGPAFGSTTFGVYLGTPAGTLYSDPALNGGKDNLVAYQGFGTTSNGRKLKVGSTVNPWDANSYVLGWEDLNLVTSDRDYQDMVLLVSSVTPVPEPATYIAAALLLIPILVQVRRWSRTRIARSRVQ